jgi:hypothetical protein
MSLHQVSLRQLIEVKRIINPPWTFLSSGSTLVL